VLHDEAAVRHNLVAAPGAHNRQDAACDLLEVSLPAGSGIDGDGKSDPEIGRKTWPVNDQICEVRRESAVREPEALFGLVDQADRVDRLGCLRLGTRPRRRFLLEHGREHEQQQKTDDEQGQEALEVRRHAEVTLLGAHGVRRHR
jgi:hypothetical protein